MIPPAFKQELLSRTDIVELVGRHVQLRKAGANHQGLCPFHAEKSPSFSVSASRQTYHCFGCGVHGNAIDFLMEHSGVGFLDAVRDLAQQHGLAVPSDERTPQERELETQAKEREKTLADVLAMAARHYGQRLKIAPEAIEYLKRRGVSGEVAARFRIGYAPGGWRNLASAFPNYDDPLLEECGLVIAHAAEAGGTARRYDRFRDRIMFPIRSVSGTVIGFGGRVLGDGEPKYLNSPETPLFVKGRELYGLHEARTALRSVGHALVVEGYMDVVALAQHGIANVVATLGTACTAEHVQKLLRFTDSIVFSFDGDAAGRRAAGRALEAALPHASDTRSIRFLFLPEEHDPDSFVRTLGAEAFERAVAQAVPLSQQLVAAARDGCDLTTAEGRARLLANARPLWSVLPDGGLKRQLAGEFARLGQLPVDELLGLWQAPGERPGRPGPAPSPARQPAPAAPVARRRPRDTPAGPADHALRLLLLNSRWWDRLEPADHELLHGLPAPHGAAFGWLERHLAEHGALPWSALAVLLDASELPEAAMARALVTPDALVDEARQADLRRVVDGLWIRRLGDEQKRLVAAAASDPAALHRWRAVEAERQHRLRRLGGAAAPTAGAKPSPDVIDDN